jgi:hypothetical protein
MNVTYQVMTLVLIFFKMVRPWVFLMMNRFANGLELIARPTAPGSHPVAKQFFALVGLHPQPAAKTRVPSH